MLITLNLKIKNFAFALLLCAALSFASCNPTVKPDKQPFKVEHVDWIYNATIYEVNIRQYTPEGTFAAFEEHLPRLNDLGIKILWLMPIYPIGELERKGTLGSYYSIKDYKGINPEFGTMDDFKRLVRKAHELGMKVIIDWVANHTSHDNQLVYDHPEWFAKDSVGNILSPFDWTDVAQLNYDNQELREYMVDALKFWVEETNIDGYRCDVAAMVPTDFWNRARAELDAIKPVFMLAEADAIELQEYAFDTDYGWEFHHIMNKIAQGKKTVLDIEEYFQREIAEYPKNTIRMHFTSNHDENSWAGTEFERMGPKAAKSFAALSFTIPGVPLIYNGQEVGFNRMLKFFEKDLIDWTSSDEYTNLYKKLINLKIENTALFAADKGADMFRVKTSNDVNIFAFTRENETDKIFAVFNLSNLRQSIELKGDVFAGTYTELFSDEAVELEIGEIMDIEPWQFFIFVK
ncbi:MAG: alpha-amylase family glycosyl hydrolase [Bacteroidales bacterium]|nr:alpha-amylase family glycosyl hydrolase [Bacteroidales bacterium]MDD3890998.1 alpha-amylase family glycosyl hydrolase [Bacteroidales bacterium]